MRWHKANRRRREKTRIPSLHEWVTRYCYRIYRAQGLSHEDALDWGTPRYLYPVLTPLHLDYPVGETSDG